MSTQAGIMNVIKSTKLWTAPLKEQYLPTYMKNLCDAYAASESSHRVFPIQVSFLNIYPYISNINRSKITACDNTIMLLYISQGLGLQKACVTPTWVLGSNFQVQLCEGKAKRLSLLESPCCNIGSPGDALPYFDVSGMSNWP